MRQDRMDQDKLEIDEAEPVGGGGHVVSQGECIYSIAASTGHDWKTIWEHPDNAALKEARKDPGVLLAGDKVHVPDIEPKTINLETGRRHRIVITGQYVPLRLRMCDADGEPIANARYRLEVAGRDREISTDGTGQIDTQVPATAQEAKLTRVETGEVYTLNLGHMDPPNSSSAVRKRLANLGYNVESEEGELDEHSLGVVAAFREDATIDPQATADEVLRKLREKDPWAT
jgi:hypothetical protein